MMVSRLRDGHGMGERMFLGIDVGTSCVKAVIVDDNNAVVDQASSDLSVARLHPLWSEQNADDWWAAANGAVAGLRPDLRAAVKAIGLADRKSVV